MDERNVGALRRLQGSIKLYSSHRQYAGDCKAY